VLLVGNESLWPSHGRQGAWGTMSPQTRLLECSMRLYWTDAPEVHVTHAGARWRRALSPLWAFFCQRDLYNTNCKSFSAKESYIIRVVGLFLLRDLGLMWQESCISFMHLFLQNKNTRDWHKTILISRVSSCKKHLSNMCCISFPQQKLGWCAL